MSINTIYLKKLGFFITFVFILSVLTPIVETQAFGSEKNIDSILQSINSNEYICYLAIFTGLINALSIIFLSIYFFLSLKDFNFELSLVAFVLWIVEASMLVIQQLFHYGLVQLSLLKITNDANYRLIREILYILADYCFTIHNFFFVAGAIIWYYLLFKTKIVPAWLSLWGIFSVSLVGFNILWILLVPSIEPIFLIYIPYIPFELILGVWLLSKEPVNLTIN